MRAPMSRRAKRGWIIAGTALGLVVVLIVLISLAVSNTRGGGEESQAEPSRSLPSSAQVASPDPAASDAEATPTPVTQEQAQESERYGSFGGPATVQEEEDARAEFSTEPTPVEEFEGWNGTQVQQGKDTALEAMRAYIRKVEKDDWHEVMDPLGTDAFRESTKNFNPRYTPMREVTGVEDVTTTDNPYLLTVQVGTDRGPFKVRVARAGVGEMMLVDHIEPLDPQAVYKDVQPGW